MGVPFIAFCDDGDEKTSSDGETDAGMGAQKSIGASPQGEGASTSGGRRAEEAGPPSDPSLNTTLSPQRATSAHVPSALEEREEELLLENLKKRKGALGEGETIGEIREAVEKDFQITEKVEQFQLVQDLEKERQKNQGTPVTNSAFNEVRDFQGRVQDGTGGGEGVKKDEGT